MSTSPPEQPSLKPVTTSEEDRHTASARRINLIWEGTQAVIAASVVGAALWVSASIALAAIAPNVSPGVQAAASTAFMLLSNLASLVIGFYFGRTNHERTGGMFDHQGQR